jgi:thymidylate synthase
VLQVARHDDYMLEDPPCLRHIDMRIKDNTLIFYPYFRSWDLWGGFPANLAGIAVLQKTMADEIGVKAGPIVASSKGLHIYGYVEELAKLRTGK